MNFFKSVFSDPDRQQSPSDSPQSPSPDSTPTSTSAADAGSGAGAWSFGGFIETITTKSESVIQTYRRDLEEFGSGLKKETALIRDAAARAVLVLPGSLETGASVAQESLESVGHAIDDLGGAVWRGTSEIIRSIDDDASDPETGLQSAPARRYSRFEAQVMAIQADLATFTEEPEDGEDFGKWKEGFRVEEKGEKIEGLLSESNALEGLLEKLVPGDIDHETFWSRYFYKVYKLKQVEDARAQLVKRVMSREEEEEEEDLSWEVDDDDEEEEDEKKEVKELKEEGKKEMFEQEVRNKGTEGEPATKDENFASKSEFVEEKQPEEMEASKVENLEVAAAASDDKLAAAAMEAVEADNVASGSNEAIAKSGDLLQPAVKVETAESCKDSDVSIVSSQPSMPEEDDLGWDEIEDLGEHDDKKVTDSPATSSNRVDLQKRLTAVEDDEDLNWDIGDDDEQAKP